MIKNFFLYELIGVMGQNYKKLTRENNIPGF